MDEEDFTRLQTDVAAMRAGLRESMGELAGLAVALDALVRTHPDPSAFAAAFRTAWMRLQTAAPSSEDDAQVRRGMQSVLEGVEAACRVPLAVRPPGRAIPPEA